MYGSKKPAGRQKTYGKAVRTHISGIFGRSLWADVGPTTEAKTGNSASGNAKNRSSYRKDHSIEDSGSDSDSTLETEAKDNKTPQIVDTKQPQGAFDDIANTMNSLSLTEDHNALSECSDSEIVIAEEALPESSASSLKESSDKENDLSLDKARTKTKETPSATPSESFNSTVAPRSILGERNTPSSHKESPPRKRGLKKRPSAISQCGTSPLKNEATTEPPVNLDDSIQVWEDHTEEAIIVKVETKSEPLETKVEVTIEPSLPSPKILIQKGQNDTREKKRVELSSLEQLDKPDALKEPATSEPENPSADKAASGTSETSELSDLSAVPDLTPEDQLLDLCTVSEIIDFEDHVNAVLIDSKIRKLGEASYSEVFLQSPVGSNDTIVWKVIPFGKEEQCEIESIIQEIRITKIMSEIEGFIGFRGAYVAKGQFPDALLTEWEIYENERGSENERPIFYDNDQLFAIIMLENGGSDLEHTELYGWEEACDVFWQVALALARGEKEREFEHRDLHFGNIVIKRTEHEQIDKEENPEDILGKLSLEDESSKGQSNLKVALIDYTLSRAWCGTHDEDYTYEFMPLDDQALFTGKGDYQFDIYRFMRNHVASGLVDVNEEWIDWNVYTPRTNLFWLHYLTNILLHKSGLSRPAARGRYAASEREQSCYKQLEAVAKRIDPRKKNFGKQVTLESAQDLVEWAVCEEFLEHGI